MGGGGGSCSGGRGLRISSPPPPPHRCRIAPVPSGAERSRREPRAMATPTEAAMGEAARAKDPFNYDYESLRLAGLVLAIVMFVLGVLIALSKKFKCKKAEPSPRTPGSRPRPPGTPRPRRSHAPWSMDPPPNDNEWGWGGDLGSPPPYTEPRTPPWGAPIMGPPTPKEGTPPHPL
ncbi:uncharacterized protein ACIB01_019459 [Guaruba guarouba]